MRLFIGLMSGTSMDGIDAALVDIDTHTLISGLTRPYSDDAKQRLLATVGHEQTSPGKISQLNTVLGREFAFAVEELLDRADITTEQIVAIGSHGQTICHDATADIPYTVQLGCPHTIAEITAIPVIADFRTRDLVIGGQGAPFAPLYHQAVFGKQEQPLAVVNIGGIANITFLTADKKVKGHDVGPGNCLLDFWVQKHLGLAYDANGEWAATGEIIPSVLASMLADPYFKLQSPKSLGKEYFSEQWLAHFLGEADFSPQDMQATLLALTIKTIADAIRDHSWNFKQVVLCGGGVHNAALVQGLVKQLADKKIDSAAAFGINPDFLEAMMFAWLAEKALTLTPLDLTKITAANYSAIYGAYYPAGRANKNSII